MSTRDEFVARRHRDIEAIRESIGADFLLYQTLEGMVRACQWESRIPHFCMACMDGNYPTAVSREDLDAIARERRRSRGGESRVRAGGQCGASRRRR